MQGSKGRHLFLLVLTLLSWAAVLLQFFLLMKNRKMEVFPTIIQFFSYFTILTNILVAAYSTVVLWSPLSKVGRWFSQPTKATALAVYITIVGAVYNTILRFLWAPQGLQKMTDEALHTIIPVLFILYWLICVPKKTLEWKTVFPWLLYPLTYLGYILLRGSLSSLYPYPFIDVTAIGYQKVLLNCLILSFVFLVVGLLFIGIGKLLSARAVP